MSDDMRNRPTGESRAAQEVQQDGRTGISIPRHGYRRERFLEEFAKGKVDGIARQAAYRDEERAFLARLGEAGSSLPTVACPVCGAPPLKVCRLPASSPLRPRELPGREQHHARLTDHSECVPGKGCPIVDGHTLPYKWLTNG